MTNTGKRSESDGMVESGDGVSLEQNDSGNGAAAKKL
jgi:hypothetical protein